MLRRFRGAPREAQVRMVFGLVLIALAAGMGYVERNAQQPGSVLPGQIATLTSRSSDCGRVSVFASGGGCGEFRVKGISFLSASK